MKLLHVTTETVELESLAFKLYFSYTRITFTEYRECREFRECITWNADVRRFEEGDVISRTRSAHGERTHRKLARLKTRAPVVDVTQHVRATSQLADACAHAATGAHASERRTAHQDDVTGWTGCLEGFSLAHVFILDH